MLGGKLVDQKSEGGALEVRAQPLGDGRFSLVAFTLTTFLSALLLFSVQPLFAKMVLPLLGGSPSVWAVALLFFQGALLAGYGYAHALVRLLPIERTGVVHLAFSLAALMSLPIGIPAGWSDPPAGNPTFWQLGLFTMAIGLPFAAVSANAPLLQAWFARTGHASAGDPYFLYAASNLGSLAALLGYPFVLEPLFGLGTLASLWTWGFVVLIAALGLCFVIATRPRQGRRHGTIGAAAERKDERPAPSWSDRARWVGLALVPSALLTAFTTHVATDVASAPLIWVIPLSLYLLTFVVVFREHALIPAPLLLWAHLGSVLLALLQLSQTEKDTWFYSAGIGVAAFVTSTLVAHRTLYESRPDSNHLTGFYMWMSAGGVLGGIFAALIAPAIFSEVFEYPLLLALSFACRPGALDFRGSSGEGKRRLAAHAAILLLGGLLIYGLPKLASSHQVTFGVWGSTAAVAAVLAVATFGLWRRPDLQLSTALLLFLAVVLLPSTVHRGEAQRSYFGVYRVLLSDDGNYNVLQHGTTLHGAQKIRDDAGNLSASTVPMTYYHPYSPMSYAVRLTGMIAATRREDARYAVIGLGTGSLACHSASNETWRFFEIDPLMVDIARSAHFTFLKVCQPKADIVLGDARLTFAREPDGTYDLLIVDAFSSDAIPMHLMTAEAISLYATKLRPEGAAVLHISNRYLDLEAVLKATIPAAGDLHAVVISDEKSDGYRRIPSTIVVVSKSKEAIDRFRQIPGARDFGSDATKPWTDDSSDILAPFLLRYRQTH